MVQITINSIRRFKETVTSSDNLTYLTKGFSVLFSVTVIGFALQYLMYICLSRWLGTYNFGSLQYAINWLEIIAIVGSLGFFRSALRFVPLYLEKKENNSLKGFLTFATVITLATSTIFSFAVVLLFNVFQPADVDKSIVVLGLLVGPVYALASLLSEVLRANKNIVGASVPVKILRPILRILIVFTVVFLLGKKQHIAAIWALVFSTLGVTAIQLFTMVRSSNFTKLKNIQSVYYPKVWIKTSLLLALLRASMSSQVIIPPLFIGYFVGANGVGYYSIAQSIALLGQFIYSSFTGVFMPIIAPLYETQNRGELQTLSRFSTQAISIITIVTFLPIALLINPILSVFGEQFFAARETFLILGLGQLINSLTGPAQALLSTCGFEAVSTRISIIMGLTVVALSMLFIPMWGIEGAAVAVVVSQSGQNFWAWAEARRKLEINTLPI